jgi:hypothetical protein
MGCGCGGCGCGGCGCCGDDRHGGEPQDAEAIVQDLAELERRLERDLQAVRDRLGRMQATA